MTAQTNACSAHADAIYSQMENLLKAFRKTFNAIMHCATNNFKRTRPNHLFSYVNMYNCVHYFAKCGKPLRPQCMPKVKHKLNVLQ